MGRNETMKSILELVGYCVPYAFFILYEDAMKSTYISIAVMGLCILLLCIMAMKKRKIGLIIVGTLLSTGISYVCTALFLPGKEWSWYFKPFTTESLVIIIGVLLLVVQTIVYGIGVKLKK